MARQTRAEALDPHAGGWYEGRLLATLISGKNPDGTDYTIPGGANEVLEPLGYQQVTGITGATSLVVPAGARLAVVQAEGAGVRYRDDGVDPTGTVGMLIGAGASLTYTGNLAAVRVIGVAAGAILNVLYYG